MNRILKVLFVLIVVKPVILVVLGLNIRHREKLPHTGPAVLAANHNSHLDTMVLLSLFPLSKVHRIRPVAAADYFLKNKWLAWFSLNCIGIIPLERSGKIDKGQLFSNCHTALDNGDILIIFPEGSRGDPDKFSQIKKGLFHLLKDRADTKIVPIVMQGLGKALPKGEAIFVPFNCDVIIGDDQEPAIDADAFVHTMTNTFNTLIKDLRGTDTDSDSHP